MWCILETVASKKENSIFEIPAWCKKELEASKELSVLCNNNNNNVLFCRQMAYVCGNDDCCPDNPNKFHLSSDDSHHQQILRCDQPLSVQDTVHMEAKPDSHITHLDFCADLVLFLLPVFWRRYDQREEYFQLGLLALDTANLLLLLLGKVGKKTQDCSHKGWTLFSAVSFCCLSTSSKKREGVLHKQSKKVKVLFQGMCAPALQGRSQPVLGQNPKGNTDSSLVPFNVSFHCSLVLWNVQIWTCLGIGNADTFCDDPNFCDPIGHHVEHLHTTGIRHKKTSECHLFLATFSAWISAWICGISTRRIKSDHKGGCAMREATTFPSPHISEEAHQSKARVRIVCHIYISKPAECTAKRQRWFYEVWHSNAENGCLTSWILHCGMDTNADCYLHRSDLSCIQPESLHKVGQSSLSPDK